MEGSVCKTMRDFGRVDEQGHADEDVGDAMGNTG